SVLLGDGTGQDDVVKAIVAGFPSLYPLTRIYTQSYRAQSFARGMAEGLGRLPVLYIALALICMGLLLGPINFWYVKRKRRALLFFITTPLIALIGTAAIYVLSLLGEGGGRFIQYALLGTAADGGEAFVIDARMIRTGFFQPTPTFVDDAAIMPLPQGYQRKLYQIDTTDGVTLESGWLPPRLVSGIVSARRVVSRLNIELVPDGEDFKLINNLGFSIVTVAALLPGGGIGWAQAVPPGGETVLRRENNRTRFDRLLGKVAEMTGPDGWQQARLVAECDGLPYLDDGGLGGVCESGVYMYCQLGGIGEETRP
ncbi:MAG: hypothetical protein LIP23_07325, partial [Planctomycetes bacterium]|nr:hypothetical protein [Planctomycetota bacterium]